MTNPAVLALVRERLALLRADLAAGLELMPEIEAEIQRLADVHAKLNDTQSTLGRKLDVIHGSVQTLEALEAALVDADVQGVGVAVGHAGMI
ncbi:MAG TPA: hypothetical protein VFS21_30250 [Roseiflexaceae bacterium]|nr:hypothetical protein [Roseiflexaceae bacterium]